MIIDWLIKLLINYRFKKKPFMAWVWGMDDHTDISILTTAYYDDHYRYGTREEWYNSESEKNDENM